MIGEYVLYDLVMFEGFEVGCIIRVEKDVVFVMINVGILD